MNAFDSINIKKNTTMPKPEIWLVKDTQSNLFLYVYSTVLENCQWDVSLNAIQFSTEAAANAAIESWGDTGGRFIGQNPPLH